MAVLVTMRPEYFGPFSERTIAGYAHENIASFRWDKTAAAAHAHEQFYELLPRGLDTMAQVLYCSLGFTATSFNMSKRIDA